MQNTEQAMKMLKDVPLNMLQQVVVDYINNDINDEGIRKMFCNCSSIEKILPGDIIQYTLSFIAGNDLIRADTKSSVFK